MEEMMFTAWLMRNRANRRLVMVTSMIALWKKSVDEDRMMRAREHFVSSWTLLEYLEAVEDDGLFEAAKPHLDASSENEPVDADSKKWRRSLVQSKYYFAGGNARFMFSFPTSVAVSSLTKAVIALVMGGCSPGVVACLFSCFLDICNPGIISRHAGAAIAMYGGPELVKRLTYSFKDSCVAKEGWITEVLLFARIRKGGVTVDNDKRTFGWPHGRFMTVDNVSQLPTVGWVKPQTYSKGGYDAVFIDQQEGLIRFVQVARAHEGVLRIECFEKFMRWLHQPRSSFAFMTLEIFCVIEFPLTSAAHISLSHSLELRELALLQYFSSAVWLEEKILKKSELFGLAWKRPVTGINSTGEYIFTC